MTSTAWNDNISNPEEEAEHITDESESTIIGISDAGKNNLNKLKRWSYQLKDSCDLTT